MKCDPAALKRQLEAAGVRASVCVWTELGVIFIGDGPEQCERRHVVVETTMEALQCATLWQIADGIRTIPKSVRAKPLRLVK